MPESVKSHESTPNPNPKELVDGRAPEVAVGEVGGRGAVELEDGLVAVVDPEGVGGCSGRVTIGVELLVDKPVVCVVAVLDGLGGRCAVGGPIGRTGEAVAVVQVYSVMEVSPELSVPLESVSTKRAVRLPLWS